MNFIKAEIYVLEIEILTLKVLALSEDCEVVRVAERRRKYREEELEQLHFFLSRIPPFAVCAKELR